MEDEGNCGNEQDRRATALRAGDNEDDTHAFINQVKREVERCLEARMSKEQMFRELREKGTHPAATFAVYKELRHQNTNFFKEYYAKMDLRKQAERLKLLLHQYRTVRDAGAGATALGTATQPTAMAVPDDVAFPTVPVGLDGDDRQFAPAASVQLPSSLTAMHVPTGQLLHQREQPDLTVWAQGVPLPLGACTSSDGAMAVSYPWACTDDVATMEWQDEQAGLLQQWWPGAGGCVFPQQGSYLQPPSSVERLPESGSHHAGAAPRHSEQAEPSWRPGRQPHSPVDTLRAFRNIQAHVASQHGDRAHQPLHQWHASRRPQTPTECLREVWDSYNHKLP